MSLRTRLPLRHALLLLAALSCRSPAKEAPVEQRRAALEFGSGNVSGQVFWNGSLIDAAATGDPRYFLVTEGGELKFILQASNYAAQALAVGPHTLELTHSQASLTSCDVAKLGTTTFNVSAGATTTADFDLTATAGRVTGTVTIDGVAPSRVLIVDVGCGFALHTNTAGAFSGLLAAGPHKLRVSELTFGGNRGQFFGSFDIVVAAGATTNVGVLAGRAVSGSVRGWVEWNGAPVALQADELVVVAVSATGGLGWEARVRSDGLYGSSLVAPDRYLLEVRSYVSPGQVLATGEVTVSAGSMSTVSFDITATAGRLLLAATLDGAPAAADLSFKDGLSTPSAGGQFAVFAPAGTFRATVDAGPMATSSLDVSVVAGSTTDVGTVALTTWDPEIGPSGAVRGAVTWNGAPPAVQDALQLFVSAQTATGQHWETTLDADGRYTFASAAPGNYLASVAAWIYDAGGNLNMVGAPLATKSVVVSEGTTTDLDFDLSSAAGRVVGALTINGAPAAGHLWRTSTSALDVFIPIQDGRFSQLLAPGSYTTAVHASAAGDHGTFAVGSISFTIVAGQTTLLDVAPDGESCGSGTDCASGICAQGTCCKTACDGICQSCALPGSSGVCASVPAGQLCGAAACSGSIFTPASICDGSGTCQTVPSSSCSPFMCGTGACKTFCTSNSDCLTPNVCLGSVCAAGEPPGAPCPSGNECAGDLFCVDGRCCTSTCGGGDTTDCQACSVAAGGSSDGTCTPRASSSTCGAAPTSMCETAGQCGSGPICPGPAPIPGCAAQSAPTCPGPCDVDLRGGTEVEDGVTVTFQEGITSPGEVSVTSCSPGSSPATGFKIVLGSSGQYCFDINTSTGVAWPSGSSIIVCIRYPASIAANEASFQMQHDDGSGFMMNSSDRCLTTECADDGSGRCTCANGLDGGTICGFATSLSPFAIVEPIDSDAPVFWGLPGTIVAHATSTAGAVVTYTPPTAIDDFDGPRPVDCVPASGSRFPPGKTTVTCATSDLFGNANTATFTVWVQYQAPGDGTFFLRPIRPDGSSVFRIGRPVPVKFKLAGASKDITDLQARLVVTKISDECRGTADDESDEDGDESDFLFKYRKGKGIYGYRWKTRDQTRGTYLLRAELGDEVVHEINVSLRKSR